MLFRFLKFCLSPLSFRNSSLRPRAFAIRKYALETISVCTTLLFFFFILLFISFDVSHLQFPSLVCSSFFSLLSSSVSTSCPYTSVYSSFYWSFLSLLLPPRCSLPPARNWLAGCCQTICLSQSSLVVFLPLCHCPAAVGRCPWLDHYLAAVRPLRGHCLANHHHHSIALWRADVSGRCSANRRYSATVRPIITTVWP